MLREEKVTFRRGQVGFEIPMLAEYLRSRPEGS
jgi:hypothetical protein